MKSLLASILIQLGVIAMLGLSQGFGQQDQSHEFGKLHGLFGYDKAAALNLKESRLERRGEVVIRDIMFTPIPGGKDVKAYLVTPSGGDRHAGILWVHWLGEEHSNRTQFLDEAITLASRVTAS